MSVFKDISGQVFGYLTAIEPTEHRIGTNIVWHCVCSCGAWNCKKDQVFIRGDVLRRGSSKSCHINNSATSRIDRTKHPAITRFYSLTRSKARCDRNIPFDLTVDQFHQLIKQPCYYCGSMNDIKEINTSTENCGIRTLKKWHLRANGIDRYDSDLGYTIDNCVPCCWDCNQFKGTKHGDVILAFVQRVANYQKSKQKCARLLRKKHENQ